MEKEDWVNCFAYRIIAAEWKRYITDSAWNICPRKICFYVFATLDKVDSIVIVIINSCCNGKNIRIKNNIIVYFRLFWREWRVKLHRMTKMIIWQSMNINYLPIYHFFCTYCVFCVLEPFKYCHFFCKVFLEQNYSLNLKISFKICTCVLNSVKCCDLYMLSLKCIYLSTMLPSTLDQICLLWINFNNIYKKNMILSCSINYCFCPYIIIFKRLTKFRPLRSTVTIQCLISEHRLQIKNDPREPQSGSPGQACPS